jgi:pimeloyl-ACP methyl ester carboxylesterase
MYAIENIEILYSNYMQAIAGEPDNLIKQYNEFYKTFPGDITMGDIIVKKQGRVSFNNSRADSFGDKITNVLNTWYTPNIDLLQANTNNKTLSNDSDSVEVLFISGEFDVASPPLFLKDDNYLGFSNSCKVIIPNAGHLDMFYSKKHLIEDAIVKFFVN